jgi:hypothetical protein
MGCCAKTEFRFVCKVKKEGKAEKLAWLLEFGDLLEAPEPSFVPLFLVSHLCH